MLDVTYPAGSAPVIRGAKLSKASEMLPIVEESGSVTAQAPRSYCHNGSKVLHPVVHLHIINREGQIYLQKRGPHKKIFPLRWDTAVGGHVTYGETIIESLFRESGEELGLLNFNPYQYGAYVFESKIERELIYVFAAVGNFELKPDNDEVVEGRWWSIDEIESKLGKGIFTPNFESEYQKVKTYLLSLL